MTRNPNIIRSLADAARILDQPGMPEGLKDITPEVRELYRNRALWNEDQRRLAAHAERVEHRKLAQSKDNDDLGGPGADAGDLEVYYGGVPSMYVARPECCPAVSMDGLPERVTGQLFGAHVSLTNDTTDELSLFVYVAGAGNLAVATAMEALIEQDEITTEAEMWKGRSYTTATGGYPQEVAEQAAKWAREEDALNVGPQRFNADTVLEFARSMGARLPGVESVTACGMEPSGYAPMAVHYLQGMTPEDCDLVLLGDGTIVCTPRTDLPLASPAHTPEALAARIEAYLPGRKTRTFTVPNTYGAPVEMRAHPIERFFHQGMAPAWHLTYPSGKSTLSMDTLGLAQHLLSSNRILDTWNRDLLAATRTEALIKELIRYPGPLADHFIQVPGELLRADHPSELIGMRPEGSFWGYLIELSSFGGCDLWLYQGELNDSRTGVLPLARRELLMKDSLGADDVAARLLNNYAGDFLMGRMPLLSPEQMPAHVRTLPTRETFHTGIQMSEGLYEYLQGNGGFPDHPLAIHDSRDDNSREGGVEVVYGAFLLLDADDERNGEPEVEVTAGDLILASYIDGELQCNGRDGHSGLSAEVLMSPTTYWVSPHLAREVLGEYGNLDDLAILTLDDEHARYLAGRNAGSDKMIRLTLNHWHKTDGLFVEPAGQAGA